MNRFKESVPDDLVFGRWPVREALEAGPVAKLLLAQGVKGQPIDEIVALARKKNVPFHWVDRRKLDQLVGTAHQGVIAQVAPLKFAGLDEVLDKSLANPVQGPCALFLDGIMDPQNLGSILRSAVFFGVPGVVIPKWRAASVTSTVVRASAGAALLIPVAQVSNLGTAMEQARERGIWLVGSDMAGQDVKKADLPRPFALVMGSEGEGLHQLVQKRCDVLVGIKGAPSRAGIHSLNVGVACAILLHHLS